jgi:hypothetical protein
VVPAVAGSNPVAHPQRNPRYSQNFSCSQAWPHAGFGPGAYWGGFGTTEWTMGPAPAIGAITRPLSLDSPAALAWEPVVENDQIVGVVRPTA